MKSFFQLSVLSVALLAGSALAGGPEVPMNQTGIYIGLGGAYNTLNADLAGPSVFSFESFSPVAQVGYWGNVSGDWLLGAKAWYKYLDIGTSGSFEVPHEFSFMSALGYMLSSSFIYVDAGPVFFDVGAGGSTYSTNSWQLFWGGAAQVGWGYYVSPTWFVDLAYTYAISGTYNLAGTTTQIRSQEFVLSANKVFAV